MSMTVTTDARSMTADTTDKTTVDTTGGITVGTTDSSIGGIENKRRHLRCHPFMYPFSPLVKRDFITIIDSA